ncbi:YdcH family protein [Halovulum sp. GXIMD14793]
MSHVPHGLAEEFPLLTQRIHDLKLTDPHFRQRSDEYHELNRAIHRAETNVAPMSDTQLNEMLKKRVHLKDELYRMLKDGAPETW